jgi:hypothetical protein
MAASLLQNAAPLPLQLKRFITNGTPPPTVLRPLQRAGLQQLAFDFEEAAGHKGLCSALAGLQDLKELTLVPMTVRHDVVDDYWQLADTPCPVALAAAVGQLQHLTNLGAFNLTPAGSRLLPASL